MLFYIGRRLLWLVVTVLFVLLITFLVFFKLPAGNPAPNRTTAPALPR